MKARNINIAFYILGARVDTVDKDLLRALRDAGCFMIEYGFEHGSQRMLDMMEKRATVAENHRIYHWTRDLGMYTVPSNVINMPGETQESINETIEFMKSLKGLEPNNFFINYAQAHPGTPLFDYALQTGMISDADEYLEKVSDLDASDLNHAVKRGIFLNFSEKPIEEVMSWQTQIQSEVNSNSSIKSQFSHNLSRIRRQIGLFFSLGLIDYLNKYGSVIVIKIKHYFINSKVVKGSMNKQTDAIVLQPQIGLEDELLINKIKKFKYSNRKVKTMNIGRYNINYYEDTYEKMRITRGPSLREFLESIQSQSNSSLSTPTDTKKNMKGIQIVNLDKLMAEFPE